MNSMKRQKDMRPQDEYPPTTTNLGQKMSNILLGKSRGELSIAPERIEQMGQNRADVLL